MRQFGFPGAAAGVALLCANAAVADIDYSFFAISDNNATNVAIGEAQLSMSVCDIGAGQASFLFSNVGPDPAIITLVVFEDSLLTGLDSESGSAGVEFSIDGSPANLPDAPGGYVEEFSASRDSGMGGVNNGVNPGETLTIITDIGGTFADLIDALNSGELRVGLHVQSIGQTTGSEAFLNNVPGPAALGMLAIAFVMPNRRRRSL